MGVPLSWFYGLKPIKQYDFNLSASIAPEKSHFKIKNLRVGLFSTRVGFEVTNPTSDTLRFSYLNPDDPRSIKIVSTNLVPYFLNKFSGTNFFNSTEILHLRESQDFNGAIVIPPKQSRSIDLYFQLYGSNIMRKFSVISEDESKNQTYLKFDEVEF